eukprot:3610493-Pleurochrysis_carterae.AAC.1
MRRGIYSLSNGGAIEAREKEQRRKEERKEAEQNKKKNDQRKEEVGAAGSVEKGKPTISSRSIDIARES